MTAETRYIRLIQKMAGDIEFQEKHIRNKEKDFKRVRKLTFKDVLMYTIGNTRSPIGLEASRLSKYIPSDKISGAALCKARQKIKYTAYEELFEKTAAQTPRNKTYRGYHLLAVDGMKGELPKTPEFVAQYRTSAKIEAPIFHAVSAFDVLNEIFIKSAFHLGAINERTIAGQIIDATMQDPDYRDEAQIWIFDRGFPSLDLIQKLIDYNLKFVMRVSSCFLKEINDFRESKYVDQMIHVGYTKKRMSSPYVRSNGLPEFDLRGVRIRLANGTDEILITNLERETFPKRDIKELYRLRWGIETSFNALKNAVFVEEFSSRSENGLAQDYYVSLLIYNFVSCICHSMSDNSPQKKENSSTKSIVERPSD